MNKEMIDKEISRYTRKKLIIVGSLLLSVLVLIICVIINQFVKKSWIAYGAIISYFSVILIMLIACKFNLNKTLAGVISKEDYKEILKYMIEIPDNISSQKYYEGLLMIKRTLNEMVYYHMNGIDDNFKKHLYYLQAMFLDESNVGLISSKVLNKEYLKEISSILLEQINNGQFNAEKVEKVIVREELNKKQNHITVKMLTSLCNVILILFVMVKIAITINSRWFSCVNDSLFWRIMYNTSIDMIAAVLAVMTIKEK